MSVWQWLVDVLVALCGLLLLGVISLVVRQRVLSRHGGTFELSYRVRSAGAGRAWILGLGRYSGEELQWFRLMSLSPRPKRSWPRSRLSYTSRREPDRAEQVALYPGHVVISCQCPDGELELGLSQAALMGFQAWLESRPPGPQQI